MTEDATVSPVPHAIPFITDHISTLYVVNLPLFTRLSAVLPRRFLGRRDWESTIPSGDSDCPNNTADSRMYSCLAENYL